jgi:hypothetical protein
MRSQMLRDLHPCNYRLTTHDAIHLLRHQSKIALSAPVRPALYQLTTLLRE